MAALERVQEAAGAPAGRAGQAAQGQRGTKAPEGPRRLLLGGCWEPLKLPACPQPRALLLQVHFVAAIDVYEDGEAGLLLCYNCK